MRSDVLLRTNSANIVSLLTDSLFSYEPYRRQFLATLRSAMQGPLSPERFAALTAEFEFSVASEISFEAEAMEPRFPRLLARGPWTR